MMVDREELLKRKESVDQALYELESGYLLHALVINK